MNTAEKNEIIKAVVAHLKKTEGKPGAPLKDVSGLSSDLVIAKRELETT